MSWKLHTLLWFIALPIWVPLVIWLKPPWYVQLSMCWGAYMLVRASYL